MFGELTGKNVPAGDPPDMHRRHLAMILDGMVISAPTINSRITERGQISGSFTQTEVNAIINVLRAGALPARSNAVLVSESEVAPSK